MGIRRTMVFALALALALTAALGALGTGALAEATTRHSLTVMGVEPEDPCKWEDIGEYVAWQKLSEWIEAAGLDITWEIVARDQYSVVVQTRLASGSGLPDVVKIHTLDNATALSMGAQGIFIPLAPAIEKYSNGNIKAAYEFYTSARPLTQAPDGNLYWFSNLHMGTRNGQGPINGKLTLNYREDWAKDLGLAEPTNLAEFTELLRQFRAQDANGNGVPDEILNIDIKGFGNGIAQWFGLATGNVAMNVAEHKAVSPWQQAGVKEYFQYIQSLVAEGILDKSLVGNADLVQQRLVENKIGAHYNYPAAMWIAPQVQAVDPDCYYKPLKPLPALDGVTPQYVFEPGDLVWEKFAITRDCKDVEGAIKLFDIVYTDEYALLTTFGIEGANFAVEDGVIKPFQYSFQEAADRRIAEGSLLWRGILPRVQKVDYDGNLAAHRADTQAMIIEMSNEPNVFPNFSTNFLALPTDEETEVIGQLQTNVDTYCEELSTNLALGNASLDDWDTYMGELEQLGLSQLIEIMQAQHDRYLEAMK